MWLKSTTATSSSGDIEAISFHSGRPARLALMSHSALSTAPAAMWLTPFSGPIQRNCESCTSSRDTSPRRESMSSTSQSGRNFTTEAIAAHITSLPRPPVKVKP